MGYDIYTITLKSYNGGTEFLLHLSPRDAQIIDMIGKLSKEAAHSEHDPVLEIEKNESRSH